LLVTSTYEHWGSLEGNPEPTDSSALCAAANYNQSFAEPGGNITLAPFGWGSRACEDRTQFLCRMQSGCPCIAHPTVILHLAVKVRLTCTPLEHSMRAGLTL
jgi:hypothetical protein